LIDELALGLIKERKRLLHSAGTFFRCNNSLTARLKADVLDITFIFNKVVRPKGKYY